jgi:ATP-binding cassette subfamily A (ABC1) protein 3
LISGMSLPAYWISNLIADMIKVYIPMILIILTYMAFGIGLPGKEPSDLFTNTSPGCWVLFLLYPLAIVPFTYLTSFLFSTDSKAQIITILVTYATGNVLSFVIFFLQLIPTTFKAGDIMRWVFCIFPSYALVNGILWSSVGPLIL